MSISIVKTDTSPFTLSEEVEKGIDENWKALQVKDSRVFNGTLLRVLEKVDEHTTSVPVASDIGYREVVGLRCQKDFLDCVPAGEQFQVLSVIAFVETADGVILLRDRNSGDWEESIELIGGFVTAQDTATTIEEYITGRVAGDISMPPETISSVECIGHVDFKSICESMFVCKAHLSIPFKDLKQDTIQFMPIPEGYAPKTHQSFFSLPLHVPSGIVLEKYLTTVKEK